MIGNKINLILENFNFNDKCNKCIETFSDKNFTEIIDLLEKKQHMIMRNHLNKIEDIINNINNKDENFLFFKLTCHSFKLELEEHMLREEEILFPYLREIDAYIKGNGLKPEFKYGNIKDTVMYMEDYEHVNACEILDDIILCAEHLNISSPVRKFFQEELKFLRLNLHEHINLENTVLYPKAIEIEQKMS